MMFSINPAICLLIASKSSLPRMCGLKLAHIYFFADTKEENEFVVIDFSHTQGENVIYKRSSPASTIDPH